MWLCKAANDCLQLETLLVVKSFTCTYTVLLIKFSIIADVDCIGKAAVARVTCVYYHQQLLVRKIKLNVGIRKLKILLLLVMSITALTEYQITLYCWRNKSNCDYFSFQKIVQLICVSILKYGTD